MIVELQNVIQPYAWGSKLALAELRGDTSPSPAPEAELWMGAHPLAPSRLAGSGQSLLEAITAQPQAYLGDAVSQQYAGKLPFLLKVLAAATPLSLQAHPSLAQAAQGFDADEAAGIPLDAPHRNYKDRNHKPELLCALGEFWALCGFRKVADTLALFEELAVPALTPHLTALEGAPHAAGLKRLFSSLMQACVAEREALAQVTAEACRARTGQASRFSQEYRWAVRLAELYPGDVGLVSALLLNLLRLEPGQAIYLPAGNLHAYLGGTGVEIMASSDNVLRGGLTPKHVNLPELLRVLDFEPRSVAALEPTLQGLEHVYETPAREFRLSYFDLDTGAIEVDVSGPEIWLVTSGSASLASASSALDLGRSRSAFVSPGSALRVSGSGRIFRAKVSMS
ncbi:MAG TPA: mannose-6-phosphate isomerase, class I [Polyangiaceae bacterium]|nr:mannose-6-phosphate isomerase, class I [Polyangiaceae bacterium]